MGGSWKPLKDGRRRCGIYECGYIEDNLCCADCTRTDCKNRCLNAPERCGQLVKPKRLKVRTKKRRDITVFALEESDKWRNEWDKIWNV